MLVEISHQKESLILLTVELSLIHILYGDDTYEEFSKKLKEDFGADITRTERDDAITLSGDLDTIYKQLLNIQTLAKGMGIDDTFLNDRCV